MEPLARSFLKFFWAKQRLYQHLSYVSRKMHTNACFQSLKKRGFSVIPEKGAYHQLPRAVLGFNRVESLQTSGPTLPLRDVTDRQIDDIDAELTSIEHELHIEHVPDDPDEGRTALRNFLSQTTWSWFEDFCNDGHNDELIRQLPDRWLACLFQFDDHLGLWVEAEFLVKLSFRHYGPALGWNC